MPGLSNGVNETIRGPLRERPFFYYFAEVFLRTAKGFRHRYPSGDLSFLFSYRLLCCGPSGSVRAASTRKEADSGPAFKII
jgi:hypothetical protein